MKIKLHKAFRMIPSHYHDYWNCGKFADWLRGTKKPHALDLEEWEGWKNQARSKNLWRYWLAEEALEHVQRVVYLPYSLYCELFYKIKARFLRKYWQIDTGLNRWGYHDPDTRLEFGAFQMLSEYVEVRGYDFIKNTDCAESREGGLTLHAEKSIKALEIYDWWADRKNRERLLEDKLEEIYNSRDSNHEWYIDCGCAEDELKNETTDKLIELVQIRSILWH